MPKANTKYILRFDDICPTMNWQIWNQIEQLLEKYNIKPLLAIIPDCQDSSMLFEEPKKDFWSRVREWQFRGYDIALHGYSHVYTNKNSGLVGVTRQSEFVGLSKDKQFKKINKGLEILSGNGVKTDIWIAPSHSFDNTTIEVLKDHNINYISDGFGTSIFKHKEMIWVPCQIWNRIIPLPKTGVYTICYHHSTWTEADVKNFEIDLMNFHEQISSFRNVVHTYPVVDSRPFIHVCEVYKRKLKNFIKAIINR